MGPGTSRSYFDIEAEKIQVQQRRPLLTIWRPLALHNNIDVGATRELCGMLAQKRDGCLRFSNRNRKVMAHFVPLHYCGEDNLSATGCGRTRQFQPLVHLDDGIGGLNSLGRRSPSSQNRSII